MKKKTLKILCCTLMVVIGLLCLFTACEKSNSEQIALLMDTIGCTEVQATDINKLIEDADIQFNHVRSATEIVDSAMPDYFSIYIISDKDNTSYQILVDNRDMALIGIVDPETFELFYADTSRIHF